MCYGKPDEMLADILSARPLVPNEHGHTALDDFEHFCAYSGCDPDNAWAKLAYISARLPKT
jgi:hypothetical protein